MRPLLESGRPTQTVSQCHTCSGNLGIVKILRYIRSDMYTVRGGSRISSWGGEAHLKKLRRAEGGAKIFGVFRVKNHDFMPTNHIFSYFRGARAGCAPPPPPGSAPDCVCNKLEAIIYYSKPQRGTPKHYGNSGTVIIHEYEECVFPNDSRARDDCYRDAEIY
jgi:hypothetical protein